MLTVFPHQVLRPLRDKTLLVWILSFPIVLSLIFMVQFFNLDGAYKANSMSFGVVQDEAYRVASGLDTLVERISANDATPYLITKVTHSTASEAEAAAKRGDTNGYLIVENGEPMLHVTQKGDAQESLRVLWMVMDSYAQIRVEHEVLIGAGTPPGWTVSLQAGHDFTQLVSVTLVPVRPAIRYHFAPSAFASGIGTTVAMIVVQDTMATSSLGTWQTIASLPRRKMLTATLAASWACVLACLLIVFAPIATVVGADFGPHLPLCSVAVEVASLMSSAAGAVLRISGKLGTGIVFAIICLLLLFIGLYGPGAQSLADSVERSIPLLAQANPLWQASRCLYGPLCYDSPEPLARNCAALPDMTYPLFTIALICARRMNHEHL